MSDILTERRSLRVIYGANPVVRAYTGATGNLPVLDWDGVPARGSSPSIGDRNLLALDEDFSVKAEVYRFSILSDTAPDPNAVWWISTDGGLTKERCKFLTRAMRNQRAFWRVFLQKV